MERAHRDAVGGLRAHQCGDTVLHFPRRLVGEGKRQDAVRLIAAVQQVHNLVGQHAGLARSGACYHERRAVEVFHGGALLVVQFIEISVIRSRLGHCSLKGNAISAYCGIRGMKW